MTVEVEEGTTVLDAALDNDIDLDHNCGGNCACSTCHVVISEGLESLNEVSEDEEELLEEVDTRYPGSRLACQCEVVQDLVVTNPNRDESEAVVEHSETKSPS
jgi:2Fe-2S ferredoxin